MPSIDREALHSSSVPQYYVAGAASALDSRRSSYALPDRRSSTVASTGYIALDSDGASAAQSPSHTLRINGVMYETPSRSGTISRGSTYAPVDGSAALYAPVDVGGSIYVPVDARSATYSQPSRHGSMHGGTVSEQLYTTSTTVREPEYVVPDRSRAGSMRQSETLYQAPRLDEQYAVPESFF